MYVLFVFYFFFFFKQKTAYEMRISDWSSDVCSSDLTSFSPSSNESAPLATRAENSPRECPAAIEGLNPVPDVRAKITECRKMAGWVTLVCFRASSVPENIMSVIRKPKIGRASCRERVCLYV